MSAALFNGQWCESVPASSRGLAYGDGLFETIRFAGGQAPLWRLHLQRLESGCVVLGLKPGKHSVLLEECSQLLEKNGDGVVKMMVWRQDAGRGYAGTQRSCDRLLQWFPTPPASGQVRLVPLSLRLAHQPRLAGLKHLNRLEQVLAANELASHQATSDEPVDGLLMDTNGALVEAVSANLFLVREGRVITPQLDSCGVAGVLRQAMLTGHCGFPETIEVKADTLKPADLASADEVFVGNSVRGVMPVPGYQQQRWAVGPVTRALDYWYTRLFKTGDQHAC